MGKSHSFSIFLLKTGYDSSNSLEDGHLLVPATEATSLPQGAQLYIMDSNPHQPWWRKYFGISQELKQVSKGAIIFLQASGRWFALTFGHVYHNLKDEAYEYDFGLKVTLNCVDPKLKSTDTVDPGTSKRQRTQMSIETDLTYFDFDQDSSILRKLTGKVKQEYKDYFKDATGASSLHINTDAPAAGLISRCEKLLEIYEKDDYKTTFPNIRDIEPVRDPLLVGRLSDKLVDAFRVKSSNLSLTIPDIVDYHSGFCTSFAGAGKSLIYNDLSMLNYHQYLTDNGLHVEAIDLKALKTHSLQLCNENGDVENSFYIFKSIFFDTDLAAGGPCYHLCDGNWYSVGPEYVSRLKTYLDPHFEEYLLPPFNHEDEGKYNIGVSQKLNKFLCLDKSNISLDGQRQVEPCDLYTVLDNFGFFIHVKVSTRSSQLSHLFNQGLVAIELVKGEKESKDKLKRLIEANINKNDASIYTKPLESDRFKLVYAIATHKTSDKKSDNLPLFSRIALRRVLKTLRWMSVPVLVCFIPDARAKQEGKEKKRKKKNAGGVVVDANPEQPEEQDLNA